MSMFLYTFVIKEEKLSLGLYAFKKYTVVKSTVHTVLVPHIGTKPIHSTYQELLKGTVPMTAFF